MSITNIQYERLALKRIVSSRNPELFTQFKIDLFGNKDLGNLYRLVLMLYTEHGEFANWESLIAELHNRVPTKDKLDFLVGMVEDIKSMDDTGSNTDTILLKLQEQKQYRIALSMSSELTDAVAAKDIEGVRGKVVEMYEQMFVNESAHNFLSSDMLNMTGSPIKFNFRKTGIPPLDKRGGLIEGGFTIIGGEAKAGKSTLAQLFAQYSYHNYPGSVAYFSFEQSKGELRARILASESGLDVGLISSDLLTPADRLLLREAEVKFLFHFDANMKDFIEATKTEAEDEFWKLFKNQFEPRENRFLLFDHKPNWDELFVQMKLLRDTKGVVFFVIDYPYLITRGNSDRQLAQWEYNLAQTQKLKTFGGQDGKFTYVVAPAQYNSGEDKLRYVQGAVNACDLFLKMKAEDGDAGIGPMGAVTVSYGAYRNFLTVPNEPQLEDFKLIKAFDQSKFIYMDF